MGATLSLILTSCCFLQAQSSHAKTWYCCTPEVAAEIGDTINLQTDAAKKRIDERSLIKLMPGAQEALNAADKARGKNPWTTVPYGKFLFNMQEGVIHRSGDDEVETLIYESDDGKCATRVMSPRVKENLVEVSQNVWKLVKRQRRR